MEDFLQSLLVLALITLISVFAMYCFGQVADWVGELRRRLALQRAVADYMQWRDMPKEIALRNVPGGIEGLSPVVDNAFPSARVIADNLAFRAH